jgi:hypothetical protein
MGVRILAEEARYEAGHWVPITGSADEVLALAAFCSKDSTARQCTQYVFSDDWILSPSCGLLDNMPSDNVKPARWSNSEIRKA